MEPLSTYMRLGVVVNMVYPDLPFPEALRKIAADPFFSVAEVPPLPEEEGQVMEIAETSGLTLVYCAQPAVLVEGVNPNALENSERRRAVDLLKGHVDRARRLGVGRMAVMSGPDPGEGERERAREQLVCSLREVCDYAWGYGIEVALETFDRDVEKRALIGPTEEAVEVVERTNRANLGLLVDLSHLPLLGEDPWDAMESAGEYLLQVHVGNCVLDPSHPAYGDKHPRLGLEGGANGVEEVTEFLWALGEAGFLDPEDPPIVSLEVRPLPGEDPDLVLAGAKRMLSEAWGRVWEELL
ncbi:MAG TPA: sugar phosphate isomerase/epimerase [Candidatus Latescibacteria bacterium]|nr:sugar phosphate isomerase/epimerase [Candidatus Latescibacterota bacterium]